MLFQNVNGYEQLQEIQKHMKKMNNLQKNLKYFILFSVSDPLHRNEAIRPNCPRYIEEAKSSDFNKSEHGIQGSYLSSFVMCINARTNLFCFFKKLFMYLSVSMIRQHTPLDKGYSVHPFISASEPSTMSSSEQVFNKRCRNLIKFNIVK